MDDPYRKGEPIVYFSPFLMAKVKQKLYPEAQNSNVMSTSVSQKANTKQLE